MTEMIRHGFTQVNGIRLHYAAAGDDDADLILFLHGFPEFWYAWRRMLESFGEDRLAVAPDLRGYNLSDKPRDVAAYRAHELIRDIRELVQSFGKERCILVGHDWGGATAWAFAIAHPEMVEKLVILNAPHPFIFARELRDNPAQIEASRYMVEFQSPGIEDKLYANEFDWLWRFTFKELHERDRFSDQDRDAYIKSWSREGGLTGGLNFYRASPLRPAGEGGENGPPALKPEDFRVTVPTLVIWGERDHALLEGNLDGLEDFVDELDVVRLPEASHWLVHEAPDEVESHIRRFIGGEKGGVA